MTPTPDLIGRRRFLWTAAIGGLAALFGEWWSQQHAPTAMTVAPFPIAGAADLTVGSALSFALPGTAAAALLVRLGGNDYVAFDQRCPHLGCPVLWSAQRERFECPCHKAVFDGLSGRVVAGPPRRGLRRIVLERRSNELWALPACDPAEDEERSV